MTVIMINRYSGKTQFQATMETVLSQKNGDGEGGSKFVRTPSQRFTSRRRKSVDLASRKEKRQAEKERIIAEKKRVMNYKSSDKLSSPELDHEIEKAKSDTNPFLNGFQVDNIPVIDNGIEFMETEIETTSSIQKTRSRSASLEHLPPPFPVPPAAAASINDVVSVDVSTSRLISREFINLIDGIEENSLKARMKSMAEEREDLIQEVQRLRLELENARNETLSGVPDYRPPSGLESTNGITTPSSSGGSSTCGSVIEVPLRRDGLDNGRIGTPTSSEGSTCGSVIEVKRETQKDDRLLISLV